MPVLSSAELNERIDALLRADDFGLDVWHSSNSAPLVLTYRFETSEQGDFPWDNVGGGFRSFTAGEEQVVRNALDLVEDFLNVDFVELAANDPTDANFSYYLAGDLYTDSNSNGSGRGRWQYSGGEWDGSAVFRSDLDLTDSALFDLVIHEIGHTLGLKHPGDYDVGGNNPPGPFLPANEDNEQYTVMSYNDAGTGSSNPLNYMLYDLAALQKWWGANLTTRTGDDVYSAASGGDRYTIWDAGGEDELNAGVHSSVTIRLDQGAFSSIGSTNDVAIGYGVEMENARGSNSSDTLAGNELNNRLEGRAGNDLLEGDSSNARDHFDSQAFRMYQAALDRQPDGDGLEYWASRLFDGSETVLDMANGFVTSTEFVTTYGALDNSQFVDLLYNNVLDRDADTTGLNFWLNELATGSTRAEVVVGFSESREFVANTQETGAGFLSSGIPIALTDDVYRLYQATLDRDPDVQGLLGWLTSLGTGTSKQQVADGFVSSSEFQSVYGALDDTQFVNLLYNNVLDRDADSGGLAFWLGEIGNGATRAEVVLGFSDSLEFIDNSDAGTNLWVRSVDLDNDVLSGGADDDDMFGGLGADSFVFDASLDGIDFVGDLERWDTLVFNGFSYNTKEDALAHIAQVENDLVFSDQGNTVTFYNTTFADIDYADMFRFDDTSVLS